MKPAVNEIGLREALPRAARDDVKKGAVSTCSQVVNARLHFYETLLGQTQLYGIHCPVQSNITGDFFVVAAMVISLGFTAHGTKTKLKVIADSYVVAERPSRNSKRVFKLPLYM